MIVLNLYELVPFSAENTCSMASPALLSSRCMSFPGPETQVGIAGFVCGDRATRGRSSTDYRMLARLPDSSEKTVNILRLLVLTEK